MKRKRLGAAAALAVVALAVYWIAQAGSLEPPGEPESTMVTLSEIDAKLNAIQSAQSLHTLHTFIGVTTSTSAGTAGWGVLTNLCTAAFDATYPGVRMCFSEEILRTPTPWPAIATQTWVHPTMVPSATTDADFSGYSDPDNLYRNLTCGGWFSGTFGMVIQSGGRFTRRTCVSAAPVTCCAPQ